MAKAHRDGNQLDTRLRDRVRAVWHGAHGGRMVVLRRVAAALLLLLAVVLALRPHQGSASATVPVLTTTHDLLPGHVLTPDDVTVRAVPADVAPRGALRDPGAVDGRVLAGAVRSGEILTDVSFTGPALTRLATGGRDYAAVPIQLAQPGVADLIRPGRRVDVIAADGSHHPEILARKAPVLAVRPSGGTEGEEDRSIIVGLPEAEAAAVASASLTRSVTVTLR